MKMKITEKELESLVRETIMESLQENGEKEGLWGGLKGAAKGLGQAAKGEWGKFKNGVMNAGLNNEYKGQGVGDRVKTAGKQIATGFRGGDKQQELDKAYATVQSLIDGKTFGNNKVLNAPKTLEAAQILLKAIEMAKKGSVGGVNAAAKKRYATAQPNQDQPQQMSQVAESKLDEAIRKAIRESLSKMNKKD